MSRPAQAKPAIVLALATRNAHKVAEITRMLRGSGIKVLSLDAFPDMPAVVENGRTLDANAIKKANAITRRFGVPALADDSGLFVPALQGKPGVRSARYAGPACDYAANNVKLLKAMAKLKGGQRKAYFATAMALTIPGQKPAVAIGKVWGTITQEPAGSQGFGYDPVFVPKGHARTFAQMKPSQKNQISHRGIALQKMVAVIRRKLAALG